MHGKHVPWAVPCVVVVCTKDLVVNGYKCIFSLVAKCHSNDVLVRPGQSYSEGRMHNRHQVFELAMPTALLYVGADRLQIYIFLRRLRLLIGRRCSFRATCHFDKNNVRHEKN